MAERSQLGRKIANGEFVVMVEVVPPKGIDAVKEIEGTRYLKSVGVDAINIPDSPRAGYRQQPHRKRDEVRYWRGCQSWRAEH